MPSSADAFPTLTPRQTALRAAFAHAWTEADPGSTPRIEDFLSQQEGPPRLALLRELVLLDADQRKRRGEEPRPADYLPRFPDLDAGWLASELHWPSTATREAVPSSMPTRAPVPGSTPALRCPHCQQPLCLADQSTSDVLCPVCGKSFRIAEACVTGSVTTTKLLGRFQVLERVGHGAFGAVWKARDLELDRLVALKIPHAGLMVESEERERFYREARAAAQLRHPGIVTVHEVVTLEGLPVLVAEFVQGVTLREWLEERQLTFHESARLMIALAEALDYAHAMGLVHRDVKPGNILLESALPARTAALGELGTPRVMDFGLVRRADAEETMTLEGHILGTPAYMSPEQAAGQSHHADCRSDVYSLGVVLYEMLTGQLPFRGSKAMLLVQAQYEEPRRLRRIKTDVPRDLEIVTLKCLQKDPERRYPSARALADDLRRWCAGEPITARPAGTVERVVKWARRRPGVASLLLVIVVLSVLASGLITWQWRRAVQALEVAQREKADRARAQVSKLRDAVPAAVPDILAELRAQREDVQQHLVELHAKERDHARRMRLALALLEFAPTEALRDELLSWMLVVPDPAEVRLVCAALGPHAGAIQHDLWRKSAEGPRAERFRKLVPLAAFDKDNPRWAGVAPDVVAELLTANPLYLGGWIQALEPVRDRLLASLSAAYRDKSRPAQLQTAAEVLANYAADNPGVILELLLDADAGQYPTLRPLAVRFGAEASRRMQQELASRLPAMEGTSTPELVRRQEAQERLARRQAVAAVTLLHLGEPGSGWPLWREAADPTLRSYLVQQASQSGVDPRVLIRRIEGEVDVSARRALILALGDYSEKELPVSLRKPLVTRLLGWYRDHPDAGLRGAIDWLLRPSKEGDVPRPVDWGGRLALEQIDAALKRRDPDGQRGWYVNGQGQTLTLIRGPIEFLMGSPPTEPRRAAEEAIHPRRIGRNFAMATKPVTVEQWRCFLQDRPDLQGDYAKLLPSEGDLPMGFVTWFHAAEYCNWLSQKEGIPKDQWCYPDEIAPEMRPFPDNLRRTGYRLPTEAEWEFACRAGTTTSRPFGSPADLVGRYCWYKDNSQDRAWPVGQKRPNDLGMFDMPGNVWNWVQDAVGSYPRTMSEDKEDVREIAAKTRRVLRGGSWTFPAVATRSAYRFTIAEPGSVNVAFGLRVCRTWK